MKFHDGVYYKDNIDACGGSDGPVRSFLVGAAVSPIRTRLCYPKNKKRL